MPNLEAKGSAMDNGQDYTEDQKWGILLIGLKRLLFHGHSQKVLSMVIALIKNQGMPADTFASIINQYFEKELLLAWFSEIERKDNEVLH